MLLTKTCRCVRPARRIARSIAFARHIPPGQFLRRLHRRAKRLLLDALWPAPPAPKPGCGGPPRALPIPDVRSPHGTLERIDQGWRARFLGVECEMSGCVDWNMRADDSRAQLWRMNLHYFEYLHTLPNEDACTLIADWITRCRPRSKVSSSAGWTSYAVSLRLSAWLTWWSRRSSFRTDRVFERLFSASVREQANYLCANLETDLRGNHLIKNLRALTECGAAYPDSAGARWRELANTWLRRELPVQILPDGVHFERSPSYHAQVLADLLVIAAVRPRDDISQMLDDALDRMTQALVDLTHPDGLPAQLNDGGLTMAVSAAACLAAYAEVRGRPAPSPRRVFAMPDAGFYGARGDRDYIIVKMGPLGPNRLMAHAHGDWGSFEWSVNGQRVIVDQGVFEYVDGEKRRLSRSTLSHNTSTVDEAEQADFFDAFRCGARPMAERPQFVVTAHGFELSGILHPALSRSGTRQNRTITWSPGQVIVGDKGAGDAVLAARFLLHPNVVVQTERMCTSLALPDGSTLPLYVDDAADCRFEAAEWWPNMGVICPTQRIVVFGHGGVSCRFVTSKPSYHRRCP